MLRVAVMVSGGGTNLQAIIDAVNDGKITNTELVAVISNNKGAYALTRAKNAGIKDILVSPKDYGTREEFHKALIETIDSLNVDLIVLAGYLSVLGGKILEKYDGKIMNLHPALLPKFGGVGMWGHNVHEAVLASGEKESGCTIHLVDSGCDTGKILVQKKVPVLPGDTVDSLYSRIAPEEHKAIVEGLLKLSEA